MTAKKPVPKKSHQQQIAIKERRKRVHNYLQQHKPLREIAEIVGVSVDTIVQDKKAIAKEIAKQHWDVKAIDLEDLDTMEQECIDQLEGRLKEIVALLDDNERLEILGSNVHKVLGAMYNAAGSWWSKRLELKKLKGKWLGYEVQEKEQEQVTQDNRSVTININDPKSGEKLGFDDWVEGIFKPQNELNGPSST